MKKKDKLEFFYIIFLIIISMLLGFIMGIFYSQSEYQDNSDTTFSLVNQ